jgi:hypothetical protein
LVFFDDTLIFSSSWSEYLRHLHLVFTKLQEHSLFIKRSKCAFIERTVAYLGHVISADNVAMDVAKVHAVLDWPRPQSVHAVRGFLGLTGYYRCYIKDYGALALQSQLLLVRGDGDGVLCPATGVDDSTGPPATAFGRDFVVACDAMGSSIGAVLQ